MTKKARIVASMLFATILLAGLMASITFATATTPPSIRFAPGLQTMSAVNKVPDFYAEGTSNSIPGTYLKLSPQGGYLSTGGTTVNLIPWGYVTANWTIGEVYIILLANVTETDFNIAYLYLTNSSTQFIIRTFNYRYSTLTNIPITGTQYVHTGFASTKSIEMPSVGITPQAQEGNTLSAIGPDIYINKDSGQVINGTDSWSVFPLYEQLFQGNNSYNELWSLFTDNSGGYYYGIFYMPNNDPNHVILEHQLRLNDYTTFKGRSFDATWTSQGFPNHLIVRLPKPSTVKVDGFPVQTDSQGVASFYVPRTSTTIEVPNQIDHSTDARLSFSSWAGHGNSNPITLGLRSSLDLTANYKQQFQVTIDSEYGEAQGSGWYDQGANVTFSVPETINLQNGTQRAFVQWNGDYSSTSNTGTLTVNSPKHLTAIWKTQFDVRLELQGVPENSTTGVTVNGQPQYVNASKPTEFWVDSNTQLTFDVRNTQISSATTNYNFKEIQVNDGPYGSSVLVTQPITVQFIYAPTTKTQTTIDLNANPDTALVGYPIKLTGKVTTDTRLSTVTLSYSSDSKNWQPLANMTTDSNQDFSYTWNPDKAGTYFIQASTAGDVNHTAASKILSIQVDNASISTSDINTLPKSVQEIVQKVAGTSYASVLVAFAGSLLVLGATIANLTIPAGPPIFGYLIGSLLIGFVFIFPISAIVLSVKAARNHRSPGVLWLTPLLTVWVATLAVLVANGALFIAPFQILQAAEILLVSSNVFLIPLLFSVLVAKAVSS